MQEEKFAIAVKYINKNIPRVIAVGQGKLAERILEIAQRHKIEIRKEEEEGHNLLKVKCKENIPYQAYGVITEILSFVCKLNEIWKKEKY